MPAIVAPHPPPLEGAAKKLEIVAEHQQRIREALIQNDECRSFTFRGIVGEKFGARVERSVLKPPLIMTKYEWLGACVLGAVVLVGCVGEDATVPDNSGANTSNQTGNRKDPSDGTTGSDRAGNEDDLGGFGDDYDYDGDYREHGSGPGSYASNGSSELPLVSVQKAVLAASCHQPAGASACTACLLQNCCAQTEGCSGNHYCVSLAGCMSRCTEDEGCVQTCGRTIQEGVAAYQDVLSCANADCRQACTVE